jgi:short subunit dehydrogenase-like uncharacterized protein
MKVVVIGAYGYTGRLICMELREAGISFAIAGRNSEKLAALQAELALTGPCLAGDIRDEKFVSALMDHAGLLINCAGPFAQESQQLLRAVAKSGQIYLDISGEVGFLKMSRETYHETAKKSGALIIHGCAFESAIADCVLQLAARNHSSLGEVRTFYWFNTKRISPGSRITMKLAKFYPVWNIYNRAWAENSSSNQYDVTWENEGQVYKALIYPLPEIAFAAWNYNPVVAASYLLLSPDEARFARAVPAADEDISVVLEELKKKKQVGPSEAERRDHRSVILVSAVFDGGVHENIKVECRDMYRVTAQIICNSVLKLRESRGHFAGVLSPAAIFEKEEEKLLDNLLVKRTKDNSIQFSLC